MNKNQHVVPHQGKWAVKGEGNQKNTLITDTQEQAITKAREIAKNQESELLIHGRDGAIREKNSYGNDPKNVKG
ncbi:DUF2188 domain-containing protein [Chryseobacterium sp. KCF3-3]|uniref:DUF2188 domain-containing protein n=1 Tax=Chryseobacterium sp. KCF3-3 TaxID=3231511 RepID=UPI0038B401D3